ncbi:MAG: demethoxyubiquinone hydroxylase family protein [Alphaproteobacteria bacterium]
MIRVDQAGEYGAVRIYSGQLAVLGDTPAAEPLRHMLQQEEAHLAAFNAMVAERRVRPTVLQPLWHVAGYALGVATAALGPKAAMACTVAVEDVIDRHYREQQEKIAADQSLARSEKPLAERIAAFRAEELEHRDTALAAGAAEVPGYRLLSGAIRGATRLAIRLSTRL